MEITEKEKQILTLLAEGHSQSEAAKKALVSYSKAEKMLKRLRKVFNCKTTIQLVVKINADFRLTERAA